MEQKWEGYYEDEQDGNESDDSFVVDDDHVEYEE